MAKSAQISIFDQHSQLKEFQARREHGGSVRAGKRKLSRPIDVRKPLHLTLRSERARGALSMLRFQSALKIKRLVYLHAARNGIKIMEYANSGNHLHILLRTKSKKGFQDFLRSISGLIARLITGAVKGKAQGRFWDALAYTRMVTWGRDLLNTRFYVVLNEMEAQGVWSRKWKSSVSKGVSKGVSKEGPTGDPRKRSRAGP